MKDLNSNRSTPQLSHSAFWDVDLTLLDFERYSDFAIVRVFERGTLEDIREVMRYYGDSKIIHSITQATFLQPRAIALGQKFFGLSTNQFACSRLTQQAMSYSQY